MGHPCFLFNAWAGLGLVIRASCTASSRGYASDNRDALPQVSSNDQRALEEGPQRKVQALLAQGQPVSNAHLCRREEEQEQSDHPMAAPRPNICIKASRLHSSCRASPR